jgi:hypothetical protein
VPLVWLGFSNPFGTELEELLMESQFGMPISLTPTQRTTRLCIQYHRKFQHNLRLKKPLWSNIDGTRARWQSITLGGRVDRRHDIEAKRLDQGSWDDNFEKRRSCNHLIICVEDLGGCLESGLFAADFVSYNFSTLKLHRRPQHQSIGGGFILQNV